MAEELAGSQFWMLMQLIAAYSWELYTTLVSLWGQALDKSSMKFLKAVEAAP